MSGDLTRTKKKKKNGTGDIIAVLSTMLHQKVTVSTVNERDAYQSRLQAFNLFYLQYIYTKKRKISQFKHSLLVVSLRGAHQSTVQVRDPQCSANYSP